MSIGGNQQAAPGPITGPGTQPRGTQPRSTLAGLAAAAVRLLRLVGSRCCVGQADAAWRRTVLRPPAGTGSGAEEREDAG
ncbi:MAG TPA: hypothetical protein VK162_26275 [Streptosporangiaceae bacterium]|nr:hypothetical protein [Streptosporangiaceae bacterium]